MTQFNPRAPLVRSHAHLRAQDKINRYVGGLVARGKPYKCAIVAAMRKILICMQSTLKNPDFELA